MASASCDSAAATSTQKRRNRVLLEKLQGGTDAGAGRALIADETPAPLAASIGNGGLEQIRQRLATKPPSTARSGITGRNIGDAFVVFLTLARYSGGNAWLNGFLMAAIDAVLMVTIIALGA